MIELVLNVPIDINDPFEQMNKLGADVARIYTEYLEPDDHDEICGWCGERMETTLDESIHFWSCYVSHRSTNE